MYGLEGLVVVIVVIWGLVSLSRNLMAKKKKKTLLFYFFSENIAETDLEC